MTLPHGYPTPFHFDMSLLEPVHYMMHRGIKVDVNKKAEYSKEYHGRWKARQQKLNAISGRDLNVQSPKQIKEWLYGDLGLPPRKYRGKLTTREDKIRNLMSLCQEKVNTLKTESGRERWLRGLLSIMLILQIRGLRKRIGSYIDVDIDSDRRMRTTLSIGGTETGRFSSSKTLWDTGCNLQTIPHELRSMFVADEGYELGEFDLNRGESWVYAHLSGDPTMMEILQEGRDFHAETAEAISGTFGTSMSAEEIHRGAKETGNEEAYKLRFLGKKANHAFAYRMSAYRAQEVVNEEADDTGITIRVSDAKEMRRLWLQKYIAIEQWWKNIENKLSDNDRVMETPYGRQRTFYERWGDDLFKEATAYVPQSTSVDYLNTGLLRVFHEMVKPGKYGLEILHQNHDSILVQWKEGARDQVIPEIAEKMEHPVDIGGHRVSIPIEAEYGKNWGDLSEYKLD